MRYIFLVLLLFIVSTECFSQMDKYKIVGLTLVRIDDSGKFLYQKEWRKCNNLAVIDSKNSRISFRLDNSLLDFSVKKTENAYTDNEGNLIFNIRCTNDNGLATVISFITTHEPIDDFQNFIKIDSGGNNVILMRYKEE